MFYDRIKQTPIRDAINKPIDRYDKEKKERVTDWNMTGIYSGDIPVKVLSKTEVVELIGGSATDR